MTMREETPERREGQIDQALGLRELVAKRGDPLLEASGRIMPAPRLVADGAARVITITSGKGGVGKTNVVVNLALCLAAKARRC
ncbi:P-loop NTPase [bacterium]|nr:P-loop NTPase [bacterium]